MLRASWLSRNDVRLKRAFYCDTQSSVFGNNESIQISMEWINNDNIQDLCLRIELINSSDNPCATACIFDFYSGKKSEVVVKKFVLDLTGIAPGKYKTNYTFFYRNQINESVDLDCVRGLNFEIRNKDKDKLKWVNKNWGDYILPEITIKEE